ncbi:MAG: TatD family hydrolase [Bacillota bacterium]|nr:TatD family hydrolase [Bacillota bacterium]HHU61350.1 TatD family hydrolase [Natronincola sp.]
MMIDSHAHLNDPAFTDDLEQVILQASEAGVDEIINVGYDLESSSYGIELAERFDRLWAVVGLHPHDAKTWTSQTEDALRKMVKHPKVLAIGETGLDFHYDNSPRNDQREVFRQQLALAREVDLPAVIHSRDAAQETLEIIKEYSDVPCLLHCYSGSFEMAEEYIKLGCYFSFGGPITFKNANRLRNVVARMPLERVLIETDCPYLTPHPHRGKRNEPAYLLYTAEKLAEISGHTLEEIARITEENTRKFFRLVKED